MEVAACYVKGLCLIDQRNSLEWIPEFEASGLRPDACGCGHFEAKLQPCRWMYFESVSFDLIGSGLLSPVEKY